MSVYVPGEPSIGVKECAEKFRDLCRRDGWGGKGEQVHLVITWGEDIDLYRWRVDGEDVTMLDNFKSRDDKWDMEVR